jgi:hypothetical protein
MFLAFALLGNAPTVPNLVFTSQTECVNDIPDYVLVYYMNGGVHTHWSNNPIDCEGLEAAIEYFQLKVKILDCGPTNGISVPPGAIDVTEEEMNEHFHLGQ